MQWAEKGMFRNLAWCGGGKKRRRGPEPLFVFMTDTERTANPEFILQRLRPGTVVVFRHYDAADRMALGRRPGRPVAPSGSDFRWSPATAGWPAG